jgi:alpha-galactosidase
MNRHNPPWQSWSPVKPNRFKIPRRDYCPVDQIARPAPPSAIPLKPPIAGWCSWYAYGSHINHTKIMGQASLIHQHRLPVKYILIDDGWCKWGDWLSPHPHRFPQGIPAVGKELNHLGLKTGLWIAPFLIHPKSHLYQQHPDWIVRDRKGKPVDGWQITPFDRYLPWRKYILDYGKAPVRHYLHHCLDTFINRWHISLLKLDFLYAPYFDPRLTDDQLPHQYLTDLFTYLKQKYPKVYLIACGCPFEPARGQVDAIRISKDITIPFFYPIPLVNQLLHHHRVKLLAAKLKALAHTASWHHLDPDVYIHPQLSHRNSQKHQEYIHITQQCPNITLLGNHLTTHNIPQIKQVLASLSVR